MKSEQRRILEQFNEGSAAAEASPDEFVAGFLALGTGIQALGELRTYFEKLAKVAPPEIQTEAEIVAEEMKKMTDSPELSLEGFASSLFSGFAISGPLNTLGDYALQHCDQQI